MSRGWTIYNSQGIPLVTSKAHDHTAADGSGPATNDEHDGFSEYDEIAAPGAPAANKLRVYAADDSGVTRPYAVDSDGLVTEMAGYTLIEAITLGGINQTLADFTSIPAKFRNLRLVYFGASAAGSTTYQNICVRFNNDSGANYNVQFSDDGTQTQLIPRNEGFVGRINGATVGHEVWGSFDVLGYAGTSFHGFVTCHAGYFRLIDIVDYHSVNMWLDYTAINRVTVFSDAATALFAAGSVAYLYGY
ncbi:hypothetical protein LCGC14_1223620 [marine sediment metagenome]|uniref:Uncharacterized protein n=1 Tax=marine sediment metagenome TaxID=412755 RepID=A0A0F9NSW5_9ZZZZ